MPPLDMSASIELDDKDNLLRSLRTKEAFRAFVIEQANKGLTDEAIRLLAGRSRARVQQVRKENLIPASRGRNGPRWTEKMDNELWDLKEAGKRWSQIGKIMGMDPRDVNNRHEYLEQREHDAHKRPKVKRRKLCSGRNTFRRCEGYFETDQPTKEYFCEKCREDKNSYGSSMEPHSTGGDEDDASWI